MKKILLLQKGEGQNSTIKNKKKVEEAGFSFRILELKTTIL